MANESTSPSMAQLIELASNVLGEFEDNNEYHFHPIDRQWLIESMIAFANEVIKLKTLKS